MSALDRVADLLDDHDFGEVVAAMIGYCTYKEYIQVFTGSPAATGPWAAKRAALGTALAQYKEHRDAGATWKQSAEFTKDDLFD